RAKGRSRRCRRASRGSPHRSAPGSSGRERSRCEHRLLHASLFRALLNHLRQIGRLRVLLIRYMRAPAHGAAALVRPLDRDVGHEPRRRGAVPVVLARFEEDAVAGRITSTGPPSRWQRPTPSVTQIVCPCGWVCHAVRAPGVKCTPAAPIRDPSDGAATVSTYTAPVNQSLGPVLVSRLFLVICMRLSFLSCDRVSAAAVGTARGSRGSSLSCPTCLALRRSRERRSLEGQDDTASPSSEETVHP